MKNRNKINYLRATIKLSPMSEGNTCRAKPRGIVYSLH